VEPTALSRVEIAARFVFAVITEYEYSLQTRAAAHANRCAAHVNSPMNTPNEKTTDCKVLFISDDLDKGALVQLILRERNDKVRYASYSREVLVEADRNPPDMVIIDYNIADPDSFETYRQLKARPTLQNVPVLFVGAAVIRQAAYSRVQSLGAEGCLMMPWGPEELLAARDAVFEGSTYFP
jgi:response regulator RpfG family c-di-GMP phosphodiesterase